MTERQSVRKSKKDKHFIHKPEYPGGPKAFRTFVKENLRYPAEALSKKVEGTVRVRYEINYLGKVIDTKVLAGIGHGCDEEAQRVIRLMKFEVPKNRGVKVSFHRTTNRHFKLNEARRSGATSYVYSTPSKAKDIHSVKKPETQEKKKGNTYTYTIWQT